MDTGGFPTLVRVCLNRKTTQPDLPLYLSKHRVSQEEPLERLPSAATNVASLDEEDSPVQTCASLMSALMRFRCYVRIPNFGEQLRVQGAGNASTLHLWSSGAVCPRTKHMGARPICSISSCMLYLVPDCI